MIYEGDRGHIQAALNLMFNQSDGVSVESRAFFVDRLASMIEPASRNHEKLVSLIRGLEADFGVNLPPAKCGCGKHGSIACGFAESLGKVAVLPNALITSGPTLDSIIEAIPPGTRITIDRSYGEEL